MNQYPGFVPMVVPQPFVVAMPTALPIPGAIGHGLSAMPQVLHSQVHAAHMVGSQIVNSGLISPQNMQGAIRQGFAQFGPSGQFGQHIVVAGQQGILPQNLEGANIPMAKVIPQVPSGNIDNKQKLYGFSGGYKSESGTEVKGNQHHDGWLANPVHSSDQWSVIDSACVLDPFNSDLNLVVDTDGLGASVLLDPPGFCFTWAGARATYGACKGKVFFEVHILEHLPVDFGEDHQEQDPHVVRVGWSIDSSSFQLGEEPWSYGYGGTGKFSTNCRFSDYGQRFGDGDVVGAMLDLDSRPATVSFTMNGKWLGVAVPLHGFPVGSKDMALYPHVLSKNCRLKVNFGQTDGWFLPTSDFAYIGRLPLADRVRGMRCPERRSDCEMIMIVGLPGVGKTTWGIHMQKSHPEKRYNIIGTDTLIEKMRVMGLPRKRNYHGRWEVLIDKASKCLNKLFDIASRRNRNYILDQTNVYASARRRKMKNFSGFFTIGAVIQPDDAEMQRRSYKRTHEDGKFVPESAVLEMKANFVLPEKSENLFDRIDFIELPQEQVAPLVQWYMKEGKEKRPPPGEVFRTDSRFQKNDGNRGMNRSRTPPGQNAMMPPRKQPPDPAQSSVTDFHREHGVHVRGQGMNVGLDMRMRTDDRRESGALNMLKQQYDEVVDHRAGTYNFGPSVMSKNDFPIIKQEPFWSHDGGAGRDMSGQMVRTPCSADVGFEDQGLNSSRSCFAPSTDSIRQAAMVAESQGAWKDRLPSDRFSQDDATLSSSYQGIESGRRQEESHWQAYSNVKQESNDLLWQRPLPDRDCPVPWNSSGGAGDRSRFSDQPMQTINREPMYDRVDTDVRDVFISNNPNSQISTGKFNSEAQHGFGRQPSSMALDSRLADYEENNRYGGMDFRQESHHYDNKDKFLFQERGSTDDGYNSRGVRQPDGRQLSNREKDDNGRIRSSSRNRYGDRYDRRRDDGRTELRSHERDYDRSRERERSRPGRDRERDRDYCRDRGRPEERSRSPAGRRDHTTGRGDHTTGRGDHTAGRSDHTTGRGDHTTGRGDHTAGRSDHTAGRGDHTAGRGDHAADRDDHTTGRGDHAAEPRQRRRKSKWDNPDDDAAIMQSEHSNTETADVQLDPKFAGFNRSCDQSELLQIKQEPVDPDESKHPAYDKSALHTFSNEKSIPPNRPPPSAAPVEQAPQSGQVFSIQRERPTEHLLSSVDMSFGKCPSTADECKSNMLGMPAQGEASLSGQSSASLLPDTAGGMNNPVNIRSTSFQPPSNDISPPFRTPRSSMTTMPPYQPGGMQRLPSYNLQGSMQMRSGGNNMDPTFPMQRNPNDFIRPPGNFRPMTGPPPNMAWNHNYGSRGVMAPHGYDRPLGPGRGNFSRFSAPMRWP